MNIRPIHTDDDHRAALAEIERLWDAPEGSEDAERLDILATLVERYEEAHWPADRPDWDAVDVLHYAITEMGHTQKELGDLLGSRSRASEILKRNRALTVEMIRTINEAWKIPAELLLRRCKEPA
ncbi:MAG TPA: transcriptional regulator [Xanthobacteraceae bacterium]|jgi:HTH-type transcriptional regulator/antitoxin HigA